MQPSNTNQASQPTRNPGTLRLLDPVWDRIRGEAEAIVAEEPALASFVYATVLSHATLEDAVIHRLAQRLDHSDVPGELLRRVFEMAVEQDETIGDSFRADISAVIDRDAACKRMIEPILYFKGFSAIQTHRFAHFMWQRGRRDFALYLQSRASSSYGVDIHPAARLGRGILLDHATGLVVGETTVIEDDVSILQSVTLGGTGKESGDRHPKIRRGVLIGSGAKILGNIEVGECARVGAGSVVLDNVPRCTTVAGVPAKVVGTSGCDQPSRQMDQNFTFSI
ncbi:serine O-acetyltransferase [Candidatus Raskinella chloraquaticus]|uniref:Serine acetyltransferase n=1 Tax=Candidatus Raskinella chloraquaticus TaxID=1951219 RepID=A0A1W9HTY9_9HYPH|nr:serine O-acetyltransferase [Hyphomicrobiales bacterium]OQW50930.1 MAG: serine acetyltransferase [Proteobacteria bacterium SG_bin8]OQW81766.1 MAG: serine O-acetyltransferase [Proteobacteria bacterium ST_bin15]